MPNGHTNPRRYNDICIECIKCREMKRYYEFHKDSNKYKTAYYCKVCTAKVSKAHHNRRMKEDLNYKLSKRDAYIKNKFGFGYKEYEERLAAQGNICAVCELALLPSGYGTHLDHCHKTGKIRAFLCTNCNRGLGHFQDSPTFLRKAAAFVEAHSENGNHKEVKSR